MRWDAAPDRSNQSVCYYLAGDEAADQAWAAQWLANHNNRAGLGLSAPRPFPLDVAKVWLFMFPMIPSLVPR